MLKIISLRMRIKEKIKRVLFKINPIYRKLSVIENSVKNIDDKVMELSDLRGFLKRMDSNIVSLVRNINLQNSLSDDFFEKQVNISIICLIYKSTKFAKAVHDSLYKYTPKLLTGEAELLFVANDATDEVITFLKREKYNFVENDNEFLSDEDLFKLGYGVPEYISRVYKGYNCGIRKCSGDIVVLINSDNMFSPNWLENLLKNLDETKILDSQLVERKHPKYGIFPTAIRGEFGSNPDNFKENKFMSFVKKTKKDKLILGGAYMPCMVYKKNIEKVGYYPEGNIAGKSFNEIVKYGDERFYAKLDVIGVKHYTVCDSVVYHFKEGEKED